MNGTPRLRSAFPQTPQTASRFRDYNSQPPSKPRFPNGVVQNPSVNVAKSPAVTNPPLIPATVIDAPSQRLYVAAFYLLLNTWRVYESWTASDDLDSTWLFLKWAAVDGVFLFGLQALRIPWLEWAFPTTLAVFLLHVAGNIFLMFQIPIPVGAWVGGAIKLAYDRELSISERSVKPGDIIHNASLILGKQIVHILPEGSAILNPDHIPLCLDPHKATIDLPIRVNQTDPILIELLRLDYDTGGNETISIPARQLKQLKRQAEKFLPKTGSNLHRDLMFPVKRPGVYRLKRVVDESNLDVHMRSSDALVASCPRATIKDSPTHKCRGELSNLVLVVEGTPPLKIKYSRQVNNLDRGFSFQNIQPDQLRSPLLGQRTSGTLFNANEPDLTWARSQTIEVPLNESLSVGGDWTYTIEEVHDGSGNIANYSILLDAADRLSTKSPSHWHEFSVHERPRLSLSGCNDQSFLEVAQGASVNLPLKYHQAGQGYENDGPFSLVYTFSGESPVGLGDLPSKIRQASLGNLDQKPQIKEPGWYRLNSLSSQYCSGEVLEPSSCYLRNPPEPELTIKYERVFDKCANNPVGLLVDLDLTGSPPFRLRYVIEHAKGVETRAHTIDGLLAQLDFTPSEAGLYRYRFLDIADTVYGPQSLKDKVPVLEQDVKPPASAHFLGSKGMRKACFGEPVSLDVALLGEGPWTLQYEVVHNGKKTKYTLESDNELSTIVTERLVSGGEYLVLLTSVKDRSNCKRTLKDSIRVDARPKPPHVSFGEIEKSRRYSALQDSSVDIPIRFSGERPWNVKYRNSNASSVVFEKTFWHENSFLTVTQDGQYELLGVADSSCPGFVDQGGGTFEVSWIPRPRITAVDGSPVRLDGHSMKRDVCQGDDDSLELRLSGHAPFSIQYEQQRKPLRGSSAVRVQNLRTALHAASLEMDTSEAGSYTYKFTEVGDNLYDQDPGIVPVVVTQKVNPLPSAHFDSPGRIYGFCKEDVSGEELIPITLEGVAPFSLEIAIKHHTKAKPEIVSISNINANKHQLPLPRRHLDLGQHVVSIRKVTDARGCQQTTDYDASSVRVAVSDVPTIIPLESKSDYCVGERLSFSLSGHAPFNVFYTFDGASRKATSKTTNFRRIAEKPGVFSITAVSDGASGKCKAHKSITKTIHEMPSVRISKGQVSVVDIHEGSEAELQFEFWGTPPFEFTYVRSSNARKGKKTEILDVKHDISYEHTKSIKTSDEGTYEVVAIKDKYCSFSSQIPIGKTEKGMMTGA
ncbi:putative nuclear envelope pore membrane protein [Aspergillus saccharolyticus JOP 1030-1]|uniref:Nuclear envelope pore membrane protein n=1 Tax=Aspergillus saccharolyticus JOP 1030-1 TaxID=1450539 RepID=A0A318Z1F8_9EURO|nr:nuclear envelope pore membrane protein [Aspergillus saccharolyticus JOP 1030-1]PYH41141.1 nuclear envelope pore membrane protein [Aspergillus saccharolyticus JOP 1030-1]